jgi:hypothetical protein
MAHFGKFFILYTIIKAAIRIPSRMDMNELPCNFSQEVQKELYSIFPERPLLDWQCGALDDFQREMYIYNANFSDDQVWNATLEFAK